MRVELLRPWNGFRAGFIFAHMGDGEANLLIKRGLAKCVNGDIDPPQTQIKFDSPTIDKDKAEVTKNVDDDKPSDNSDAAEDRANNIDGGATADKLEPKRQYTRRGPKSPDTGGT